MCPCDVSVIVLVIGSGAGPVGSPWLWRFVVQDFGAPRVDSDLGTGESSLRLVRF